MNLLDRLFAIQLHENQTTKKERFSNQFKTH